MKRICVLLLVLVGSIVLAGERENRNAKLPSPKFLTKFTPPATLVALPITGKGDKRSAGLRITNTGKRSIRTVVVQICFLRANKSIAHKTIGTRGWADPLKPGKSYDIEVSGIFMTKDTTSVGGTIEELVFTDGSVWPGAPATPPKKVGDDPVAIQMVGVVGVDNQSQPVLACFNYSSKIVTSVRYVIRYCDKDGKLLKFTSFNHGGELPRMAKGQGTHLIGGDPPPKGTRKVEVFVSMVGFSDKSHWPPRR